jgi:hypothetical protein
MRMRTSTSSTGQAPTKRLVIALRALALGGAVALVAAVALGSVNYVPTDNGPNFFNNLFVSPEQTVKSNVVTMHSFDVPLPVSVLGDASMQYRINGKGGWTAQPGTISAGDTLQLRLTAADAFGVTTSGQVRIGDAPFNWSIRTRDAYVHPVAQSSAKKLGPVGNSGMTKCPLPGDYIASLLPSADDLWADQEAMVSFGPRIIPRPGMKEWENYLFDRFSEIPGLVVSREPVAIPGGWADYFSPTAQWSLTLIEEREGQDPVETEVPVAGFRPYSGTGGSTSILTPPEGVVAELVTSTANAAGNILLGPPLPGLSPIIIPNPLPVGSYWHDPEGQFPGGTEYDNWPTSTGNVHTQGFSAGALAAIAVLGLSNDAAAGLWAPFGVAPSSTLNSVPTLYVGKESGELLYAKVAEAAADPDLTLKAHLTLYAEWHLPGSASGVNDDVWAILPGRNYEGPDNPGETVIFSTHMDGISAVQENGAVGLLGLAEYFAQLPQECRNRTLVFPVAQGHFRSDAGGDYARWTRNHPALVANAVARVGIEHLGAMSWQDGRPELTGEEGYAPTGLAEPSSFQGLDQRLTSIATDAIILEDLRFGSSIFGAASTGTPTGRYISGAPWMFNWGIKLVDEETGDVTFTLNREKVSKERLYAEVRTFLRMASQLDKIDLTTIPLD